MPVYCPKRFARPETLREIAPRDLLRLLRPHRRFFAEHGLELPPEKGPAKLDLVRIGNILLSPDLRPPPALADALHHINQMSCHEGMDALLPVIEDGQFSFRLAECTPADVAVRAWLADPEQVRRKNAEIQALRPRRFEYFQGRVDPPAPLPELTPELLTGLEGYLDATFVSKGRGRGVKVQPCPAESDCMFIVRHGDPNRREGALEDREETSVFYRPLRFDVVGYDATTGALRVHAKTLWETSLYRNAFGRFLFGAIDFFPNARRYTLEPLRSGDACLACGDMPPMKYVLLVELHLRRPGAYGGLVIHRCSDVLASLRRHKQEIPADARIELAMFNVFVFGEQQPRHLTILPPNIARYSHESDSRMYEQWLSSRGFIHGGAGAERDQASSLLPSH